MVQITNHGEITNLYHHHDGYIMGVGLDLALKLHEWSYSGWNHEWNYFLKTLPRGYESVDYSPDYQGDLEFVYTLDINPSGVVLKAYKRKSFENSAQSWKRWESVEIFRSEIQECGNEKHNITKRISLVEQ